MKPENYLNFRRKIGIIMLLGGVPAILVNYLSPSSTNIPYSDLQLNTTQWGAYFMMIRYFTAAGVFVTQVLKVEVYQLSMIAIFAFVIAFMIGTFFLMSLHGYNINPNSTLFEKYVGYVHMAWFTICALDFVSSIIVYNPSINNQANS